MLYTPRHAWRADWAEWLLQGGDSIACTTVYGCLSVLVFIFGIFFRMRAAGINTRGGRATVVRVVLIFCSFYCYFSVSFIGHAFCPRACRRIYIYIHCTYFFSLAVGLRVRRFRSGRSSVVRLRLRMCSIRMMDALMPCA